MAIAMAMVGLLTIPVFAFVWRFMHTLQSEVHTDQQKHGKSLVQDFWEWKADGWRASRSICAE